ncbi:uncharacterized protein [Amphiura filiformis]|uniref:uncharacterized protein n=1 Tax=Amphiura filiformis TaxID=82378 RepID=UPI003B221FC4
MEYYCKSFSKFSYFFASIMKCNMIPALVSVLIGGSPWLVAESHSIGVEVVGGYGYSGLVVITFRNASKVTHKGYLCDDESWNIRTGEVLCKHSGNIGVQEVLHNAENKYGIRQSDSYLHGLSCEGDEESLTECSYQSWSKQRCAALAGVLCNTDKYHQSSGFYGSFFARIFMSTMFVPVCTLLCVLCRCCHRHYNERRRLNLHASRFSQYASRERTREIELGSFPTMMASSDNSADLPSYDQIIKDKFNTFKKVSSASRNDDEEIEEPPPAYETVIGTWTDQNEASVT